MKKIQVAGLDYRRSAVEIRERFAFTASASEKFLTELRDAGEEAVLISTCNRTELCLFSEKDPARLLRQRCGDAELYSLKDAAAVLHVFEVAAGLHSQIPLEDQILGQMKKALADARSLHCCGAVLNQLFRNAVTAGKQVRSEVKGRPRQTSAAQAACEKAEELLGGLSSKRALVIGSGEIGMLCARLLRGRGMDVSMTLRRHRRDGAQPPEGVAAFSYDDRYEALKGCDLIVSATASPHFVLQKALYEPPRGKQLILDLAVPRDIEPAIAEVCGVTLLDMDGLGQKALDADTALLIEGILRAQIGRFDGWFQIHSCMPMIEEICSYAERELDSELGEMRPADRDLAKEASRNMISKLLFSLKEKVDMDMVLNCYGALAKAARP
jgi:glutamyl-tRNA reductase